MDAAQRDRLIEETHGHTSKIVIQVERNKINIAWLRWLILATIAVFGAIVKILHFK